MPLRFKCVYNILSIISMMKFLLSRCKLCLDFYSQGSCVPNMPNPMHVRET